jgi:hypothetical protein
MKSKTIAIIEAILCSLPIFGQKEELQVQLDSIIKQADLLYNCEKVAWNASDLFMASDAAKNPIGGYVVYHEDDKVFAAFRDQATENVIGFYEFLDSDGASPDQVSYERRAPTDLERDLFNQKNTSVNQLSNPEYQATVPQGYSPDLVLFKSFSGHRTYILMGTTQPDLIPFGNDFMVETDEKGTINKWQKYHSRLIPAQSTTNQGHTVISAIHTHLKSTPLITATDICTFR